VPVALAGKELAKAELEELEAKVVLEDQVALVAQVVLEALALVQEELWRNQRSRCTLSQSLRCIVHHFHQRDIRHNRKRHPTYSNNMMRPQMPLRW